MGWEMPESAIVLFTLIDGPAFFFFLHFFYANVCNCLESLHTEQRVQTILPQHVHMKAGLTEQQS